MTMNDVIWNKTNEQQQQQDWEEWWY